MIPITIENTIYFLIQVSTGLARMAKHYRIGEVARKVGTSVETIRRYANSGLVPYELLGDQRIFDDQGIDKAREIKERKRARSDQSHGVDP